MAAGSVQFHRYDTIIVGAGGAGMGAAPQAAGGSATAPVPQA